MSINCNDCAKLGQVAGRHCEVLEKAPSAEFSECASFQAKEVEAAGSSTTGSYLHLEEIPAPIKLGAPLPNMETWQG